MPPLNPTGQLQAILQRQLNCYRDVNRVQWDAAALLAGFTSLQPKVGTLMNNTGTESTLLVLGGTLPIIYGGKTYNIPIDLYVPEGYPNQPPVIYVRPTSAMSIKEGHRHVDAEGMVYLPYLHGWRATHSNLVELCSAAAAVFSTEPPVFAGSRQSPVVQASVHTRAAPAEAVARRPSEVMAAATYATPAYMSPTGYSTPVQATPAKNSRQILIDTVTHKLQEELVKFDSGVRHDIELEFETQSKLQLAQATIAANMTELQATKEKLEAALRILPEKHQALEQWHLQAVAAEGAEDVDALITPVDIPSRQLIEAMAEYHAIEDTLYYMDRAVAASSPSITLESFLRETRKLARQQFLAKCLVNKIQQVCS